MPSKARAPPVVGMSVVLTLSLTAMGIPCSGPRIRPRARSSIELSGVREHVRVDGDGRVDDGLVARDPQKIERDQIARRDLAGGQRGLQLRNAGLDDVEVGDGITDALRLQQPAIARVAEQLGRDQRVIARVPPV